MSQIIRMIHPKKPRKAKGVFIDKRSIGAAWIYGRPVTYNADLVYSNEITVDKIVEDSQPKKKIILIKRK